MEDRTPKIVDRLWYVLAAGVILMALLVSIARLLTPVLMEHRADFEKLASKLLNRPVMIRQIEITWNRYEPELALEGVTILDPDTKTPKAEMERLEVDFNIWRSILGRDVFVQSITVSGMEVTINHASSGQVQIGDLGEINMKDTITGQPIQSDPTFNWIFSQPQLVLRNIRLHYIADNYPNRSITLKLLMLRNTASHHILDGMATLNQEMPVNVTIHVGWDGDVRQLREANGHVYLYVEGLSLPQWFGKMDWQGVSITQGLASTKLWIRWNHKQIYQVQNTFEIYNLSLYSSLQKRAELINRLSGNLGWKLDGNKQIYAGDQIFLDFPDHLWPAANFTATLTMNADKSISVNALKFNYLDVADFHRLAIMTSLLSDDLRKTLATLDPHGQLTDVDVTVPADLKDFPHWIGTGKWQNLRLNPWQNYPGVKHFNGMATWDSSKATVGFTSHKTDIILNQMFNAPLYFENLSGNLQAEKTSTGNWTIQSSDLHVDNKDLAADIKMGLTLLPAADSLPDIDLTANFSVKNSAHVVEYLPLKKFEPELVKWLSAAFTGGNVSGTAVLQGNLKDYPFDDKQGKFLITSQLKDIDFKYGPDWPHIQHLNGDLTFAGREIQINIQTGDMLKVPLKNVHGIIPYIGDAHPGVVNVDGLIETTLANGLDFVRNSPLNKTLGKDLSVMQLTGPLELKLGLSIPLKNPDETKVNGVITTSNATLSLPAWKLALEKLSGVIQFTEKDLTATGMQAEIFKTPAVLQISTLHDKLQTQTRIDLTSSISVTTLEQWLNKKLSTVATGATNYQLQVLLSSRTAPQAPADQLIITSDLKGVALALPAPYGKTAAEQKNLQVAVDLSENKYLRLKVAYNNILSAALSFLNSNQTMTLFGGQIRLGDTSATWQTSPGMLITGQVPELDIATWQNYFAAQNGTSKTGSSADLKMLRGIDISAGVLNIMNVQLHNARIQATPLPGAWNLQINSKEIGGSMQLPFVVTGKTLVGHFDHLYLDSQMATRKDTALNPKTVPAMQLDISDVRYEDMQFGHVTINTVQDGSGVIIQSLRANEPNLQLNATGRWLPSGSNLQGEINTPHFSDMLKQLGFHSSNLVASTGKVTFNLNWPGAIYAPSLARLNGTVAINMGEGKIINLSDSTNSKIGLGRLLNIFSLASLPRRLSLDFHDLSSGYSFDLMKANFTLKNGSAFTDDMRIEGAVASLSVNGRIGLQAKDLDLKLSVQAHVTGNLPLVAAIAGGPALGPVLGIATWMVDKAVSHEVSKATSSDYNVTGSWANPNWVKAGGK